MNGGSVIRLFAWAIAIALVALPIVGVLNGWFASERWPVTRLAVPALERASVHPADSQRGGARRAPLKARAARATPEEKEPETWIPQRSTPKR